MVGVAGCTSTTTNSSAPQAAAPSIVPATITIENKTEIKTEIHDSHNKEITTINDNDITVVNKNTKVNQDAVIIQPTPFPVPPPPVYPQPTYRPEKVAVALFFATHGDSWIFHEPYDARAVQNNHEYSFAVESQPYHCGHVNWYFDGVLYYSEDVCDGWYISRCNVPIYGWYVGEHTLVVEMPEGPDHTFTGLYTTLLVKE